MSLARIVFLKKKLAEKYGVEGKVAGRYIEAGYSVRMKPRTRHGELSFIAYKGSQRLAVDVVYLERGVKLEDLENLKKKAELLQAKPVLVLYGSLPRISQELREKIEELGISMKRIR